MRVKLIEPVVDPISFRELPSFGVDQNGDAIESEVGRDENDNPIMGWTYPEFSKGDIVDVPPLTAEHLINSFQGALVDDNDEPILDERGQAVWPS